MMTYKNLRELCEHYGSVTPGHLGRAFYKGADCGPWTRFLAAFGTSTYYEDAYDPGLKLFDECVGLQIGTIVEGSDAEFTADELLFPFTDDELGDALQSLNDLASDSWDEANLKIQKTLSNRKEPTE